jgi:AcrR family transcriptional regulator
VSVPRPTGPGVVGPAARTRRPSQRAGRGAQTRQRLLAAAEDVFGRLPYQEASISKITEAAGVAQGTFYLYFGGKQQIFEELVDDLNRRVRRAMAEASAAGRDRREAERLGFAAFFRFTAQHPALYRVIRQAEFVSPGSLRRHYERIADGYSRALSGAMAEGEIAASDPDVLAWCLMGVGELVGMRWILWAGRRSVPGRVFDECVAFVERGLGTGASA